MSRDFRPENLRPRYKLAAPDVLAVSLGHAADMGGPVVTTDVDEANAVILDVGGRPVLRMREPGDPRGLRVRIAPDRLIAI